MLSEQAGNGRQWTVRDFVITVLGGLAGALVGALSTLITTDQGAILITTLLGQYAGHLIALVAVLRRKGGSLSDIGFDVRPVDGLYVFFGVFLQFAVALVFTPLAQLLNGEGSQQAITELIPSVQGVLVRALLVVSVALIAPVVEEAMFRGLLYQILDRRWGARWSLVVTSLVFALFHLLGIGTEDPLRAAALLIPQLFVVGLILGIQRQRHNRLGVPIFTHAGFNLVAVLTLLLLPELASQL